MRHRAGIRHHRLAAVGQGRAGRSRSLLLAVREEGELSLCRARRLAAIRATRLDDLVGAIQGAGAQDAAGDGRAAGDRAARAVSSSRSWSREIAFRGWTRDGLVRQGSFKGLRTDKPASEIVRETPMPNAQGGESARRPRRRRKPQRKTARGARRPSLSRHDDGAEEIAGVRVTHPDRVLFEAQDVTKRDLIEHYLSVAEPDAAAYREPAAQSWCAARRAAAANASSRSTPRTGFPDEFSPSAIKEKSGDATNISIIEDERGLVAAVQVGVLELHVWGCHVDDGGEAGPHGVRFRSRRGARLSRTCATPRRTCASG